MLEKPFILKDPLEAYKGSYFKKSLQWVMNNIPVDITGYTFQGMFRESYASPTPILTIGTVEGGIEITNAETGLLDIVLMMNDTDKFNVPLEVQKVSQIPFKDFVFDIEAISPGSPLIRFQFMKGLFRVYGEVTREDPEEEE